MGFRFFEKLLEVYWYVQILFFSLKRDIDLDSLGIQVVLLFLNSDSDWRLDGKIHPWIDLHWYVSSICNVLWMPEAQIWCKLSFGYRTSLKLPHLLWHQLVISCISLYAFWRAPGNWGSDLLDSAAVGRWRVKIKIIKNKTWLVMTLHCIVVYWGGCQLEKLVSLLLLKWISLLWWIVECLCKIVGQSFTVSDTKTRCTPLEL